MQLKIATRTDNNVSSMEQENHCMSACCKSLHTKIENKAPLSVSNVLTARDVNPHCLGCESLSLSRHHSHVTLCTSDVTLANVATNLPGTTTTAALFILQ